ncbi:hypothetical protein [Gracilibacillus sp. Marseille-QA3620]
MFNYIMKRIDYVNMAGFLVGGFILLIMRADYLLGILLLIAGILLLLSKMNGSMPLYILTYFVHFFLIGLFIYSLFMNNAYTLGEYALIGAAALAVAVMALIVRTSTGTLTLFWLALHSLIIIQAFISPGSFMTELWSTQSVQQVFHTFYPLLIAFFLIGVFFDRFQTELKREYRNK